MTHMATAEASSTTRVNAEMTDHTIAMMIRTYRNIDAPSAPDRTAIEMEVWHRLPEGRHGRPKLSPAEARQLAAALTKLANEIDGKE